MQKYSDSVLVRNPDGSARVGSAANILVINANNSLPATIYSDNGVMRKANPFQADVDGNYSFYAADGIYNIQISASYMLPKTILGVELFDSDEKFIELFPHIDGPVIPSDETLNQLGNLKIDFQQLAYLANTDSLAIDVGKLSNDISNSRAVLANVEGYYDALDYTLGSMANDIIGAEQLIANTIAYVNQVEANANILINDAIEHVNLIEANTDILINNALDLINQVEANTILEVANTFAYISDVKTGITANISNLSSKVDSVNGRIDSISSQIDSDLDDVYITIGDVQTNLDISKNNLANDVSNLNITIGNVNTFVGNVRANLDAQVINITGFVNSKISDLANSTNTKISSAVNSEIIARQTADNTEITKRESLSSIVLGVANPSNTITIDTLSAGLIYQEATTRASADEAEASQRDFLATKLIGTTDVANANLISISTGIIWEEKNARSTAISTEVTQRQALAATLTGFSDPSGKTIDQLTSGIIFQEKSARVSNTNSLVSSINDLDSRFVNANNAMNARVTSVTTAFTTANIALANQITLLTAATNNANSNTNSRITDLIQVVASNNAAFTTRINSAEANVSGANNFLTGRIASEESLRIANNTILVTRINASEANVVLANSYLKGKIFEESQLRIANTTALATSITNLQAQITGVFDSAIAWNFDSDVEGWTVTNGTISQNNGSLVMSTVTSNDPQLKSPTINIAGNLYPIVKTRVTRLSGNTSGWEGKLYWSTNSHSFSETYKQVSNTPLSGVGNTMIITWDMSANTDWTSNNVTQLRIDFQQDSNSKFSLDYVTIGRNSVGVTSAELIAEQTARATQDDALAQNIIDLDTRFTDANNAMNARVTSVTSAFTSANIAMANQISILSADFYGANSNTNSRITNLTSVVTTNNAAFTTRINAAEANVSGANNFLSGRIAAEETLRIANNVIIINKIDASEANVVLANTYLKGKITDEENLRIAANTVITNRFTSLYGYVDSANNYSQGLIVNEQNLRIANTGSIANTLSALDTEFKKSTSGVGGNYLIWSEDFSNTAWNNIRSSDQSNVIMAPDGTLTGDKLTEDTSASTSHYIRQRVTTLPNNAIYTFSVYVKAAERDTIRLTVNSKDNGGVSCQYNISDPSLVQTSLKVNVANFSAVSVGDGWVRCSVSGNTRSGTFDQLFNINLVGNTGSVNYTGLGGSNGIFLWGAQLEIGNTVTPYITTTDTAIPSISGALSITRALIATEQQARVDADSAEATQRELISTSILGTSDPSSITFNTLSSGLLYEEKTARVTANDAIALRLDYLAANTSNNAADIFNESLARANADVALAQQITLLSSATGGGFDTSNSWNFDANTEGWTASGATISQANSELIFVPTTTNPSISISGLSVPGSRYPLVRAKVRRISGSSWEGAVYYSVPGGHGANNLFYKAISNPNLGVGNTAVLEWDMTQLTAGGNDWVANTISVLRLDLCPDSTSSFGIDWVAIGRNAPPASKADILYVSKTITDTNAALATTISSVNTAWQAANSVANTRITTLANNLSSNVQALITQINIVDTNWQDANNKANTRIVTLQTNLSTNVSALITQINTVDTNWQDANTKANTRIFTLANNLSTNVSALITQINSVDTAWKDANTKANTRIVSLANNLSSNVQALVTQINSVDTNWRAANTISSTQIVTLTDNLSTNVSALVTQINSVDTNWRAANSVANTRIFTLANNLSTNVSAVITQINTVDTNWRAANNVANTRIFTLANNLSSNVSALVTQINTVDTNWRDANTISSTQITTLSENLSTNVSSLVTQINLVDTAWQDANTKANTRIVTLSKNLSDNVSALITQINSVDTAWKDANTKANTRIFTLANNLSTNVSSLVTLINNVDTNWQAANTEANSRIVDLTNAVTSVNGALVQKIDSLQTDFQYKTDAIGGNYLTWSENLANTIWVKVRSTISQNSEIAPDGTLTADKLVEDTSVTNSHYMRQSNIDIGNNNIVTFSTYVKAAGRTNVRLSALKRDTGTISCQFNLLNPTLAGTSIKANLTNFGITSVGNDWYRIFMSGDIGSGISIPYYNLALISSGGSSSYTGDGTSGIYFWGTQVEVGNTATKYIETENVAIPSVSGFLTLTNVALQNEITLRSDANNAIYTKIESVNSEFQTANTDSRALISDLTIALANANTALVSMITNVESRLENSLTVNLLANSQTYTGTSWTKSDASVVLDTANVRAPDETSTAHRMVSGVLTAANHYISENLSGFQNNTIYCFSSYVRPRTTSNVRLVMTTRAGATVYASYDLSNTASPLKNSSGATLLRNSVSSAGNGWFRLAIAANSNFGTSTPTARIYFLNPSYTGTYDGLATDEIWIWGSQVNYGLDPIPYIQTTKTPVLNTSHFATITTQQDSINGINANYTVKINNNGAVSGFGLLTTASGAAPTSAFVVMANTFMVVDPSAGGSLGTGATAANTPFQVVNGKVEMKEAFVKNLTSNSFAIGDSTNILQNSDFGQGLDWVSWWHGGTKTGMSLTTYGPGRNGATGGAIWAPAGKYIAFIEEMSGPQTHATYLRLNNPLDSSYPLYRAEAGETYEFGADIAVHRCSAFGVLEFYSGAQALLGSTTTPLVTASPTYPQGGLNRSGWARINCKAKAPAGTEYVHHYIAKNTTLAGNTSSYLFATDVFVGKCPPNATLYQGWKPAPSTIIGPSGIVTNGLITNSAQINSAIINNAHIQDAAITSAKIGSAQVGTAHIADGSITTAKIGTAQIGAAQIADGNITTAKIGTAQIGTLQVLDGSICPLYSASLPTTTWSGAGSVYWNGPIITLPAASIRNNAVLRSTCWLYNKDVINVKDVHITNYRSLDGVNWYPLNVTSLEGSVRIAALGVENATIEHKLTNGVHIDTQTWYFFTQFTATSIPSGVDVTVTTTLQEAKR